MTIQTSAIIRIKLHNNNLQSFELILIKFSFKQNKKAINTLEAHRIEMHEFGIVIVQKLHYTNTTRSIYKIQVTSYNLQRRSTSCAHNKANASDAYRYE